MKKILIALVVLLILLGLIIGFGRIGQSLASYAIGAGMTVKAVDLFVESAQIPLQIQGQGDIIVDIQPSKDLNDIIGELDYISLHCTKNFTVQHHNTNVVF